MRKLLPPKLVIAASCQLVVCPVTALFPYRHVTVGQFSLNDLSIGTARQGSRQHETDSWAGCPSTLSLGSFGEWDYLCIRARWHNLPILFRFLGCDHLPVVPEDNVLTDMTKL